MDDRKLLALARKNAAKPPAPPKGKRRTYDATLDATGASRDDDEENKRFFKEMKRREF